ncbi:MAG: hypothetical protein AABZ47_18770 [Planctomycetota bacterium]
MVQQFLHGTRYIDELIMLDMKVKGDSYVHQNANWPIPRIIHILQRPVVNQIPGFIVRNRRIRRAERLIDEDRVAGVIQIIVAARADLSIIKQRRRLAS